MDRYEGYAYTTVGISRKLKHDATIAAIRKRAKRRVETDKFFNGVLFVVFGVVGIASVYLAFEFVSILLARA